MKIIQQIAVKAVEEIFECLYQLVTEFLSGEELQELLRFSEHIKPVDFPGIKDFVFEYTPMVFFTV